MGFFPNIFKSPENVFKSAAKVAVNYYTLGTINLLPKKVRDTAVTAYSIGAQKVVSGWSGGLSDVAVSAAATNKPRRKMTATGGGGRPMAFNVGQFLGGIGQAFGGSSNPYISTIGNLANLGSSFVPQPVAQRGGGGPPMVLPRSPIQRMPMGRAGVGRSLFNRFPNLAAGINALRMAGKNVTRASLYSMVRRFGPDFLISGGILSAAAISELMMAGPGRRRMNPANAKALRRSVRRIKSFHKLCASTDIIKSRRGSSSRRCAKCKQSPCGC